MIPGHFTRSGKPLVTDWYGKMAFPVLMYGCESFTMKKAEHQRTDAFRLCCWGRLLRVPWTARRSGQSILKEISPAYSLEGLILTLNLQYFTWCEELTHWKRPWCWERLRAQGKGVAGDKMVGWHHQLSEFGMSLSKPWEIVKDREARCAVCCSLWNREESDTAEWLNKTVARYLWFPSCPHLSGAHGLQAGVQTPGDETWGALGRRPGRTGEASFRNCCGLFSFSNGSLI